MKIKKSGNADNCSYVKHRLAGVSLRVPAVNAIWESWWDIFDEVSWSQTISYLVLFDQRTNSSVLNGFLNVWGKYETINQKCIKEVDYFEKCSKI